ncbi:hypothetical protein ACQKWADRAFT_305444 [Trichoderma austrokoningii]
MTDPLIPLNGPVGSLTPPGAIFTSKPYIASYKAGASSPTVSADEIVYTVRVRTAPSAATTR